MVHEATAYIGNHDKVNTDLSHENHGESFEESGELLVNGKDIFSHLGLEKNLPLINIDGENVILKLKIPTQATYNSLENAGYVLAGYLLPSDSSWDGKYPESFQKLQKVDGEEIILFYSEGNTLVKLFFIKNRINKEIQGNQTNFISLVNQLLSSNK